MEQQPYSRPGGVRDVEADELRLRSEIEAGLLGVFGRYGFEQVQAATLEYRDLYGPERIGYELYHHLILARVAESRDFPSGGLGTSRDDPPEPVNDVALRPDFTTPLARLFAEKVIANRGQLPDEVPYRWSYAGQVFRDWPPRSLRLREFRQVGAELLGSASLEAEAEILAMACDAAAATGVRNWRLHVGHAELYRALLRHVGVPTHALRAVANGMAQLARIRLAAEADDVAFMRFLDGSHNRLRDLTIERARRVHMLDEAAARARVYAAQPELEDVGRLSLLHWRTRLPALYEQWFTEAWQAPGLSNAAIAAAWALAQPATQVQALCARVGAEADTTVQTLGAELAASLTAVDADVTLSPAATRGIGYYTGLTFEIHAPAISTTDTDICGGGRYAGLTRWIAQRALQTRNLGDNPVELALPSTGALSGMGLAFGIDRLVAARRAEGTVTARARSGVYVAVQAPALFAAARVVARQLRDHGHTTTVELSRQDGEVRSLGEQYGRANHSSARWVLLLADREWGAGRVRLKDLASGAETDHSLTEALAALAESR